MLLMHIAWLGSYQPHIGHLLITLRQKDGGNGQHTSELFLQDGTTPWGLYVCPAPCLPWAFQTSKDSDSTQGRRLLPAGRHRKLLAQALHTRNTNALDLFCKQMKAWMATLTVPKPLLSLSSYDLGTEVEELTALHGWRHSFHPMHLFLWWKDLDNTQKSEQFSQLKKKKRNERVKKPRERCMMKQHRS